MTAKLQELGQVAKKVWEGLDDKTKNAYYYDTGTCGFLENVVTIFREELTHEEYEELSNYFDQETNFYARLRNVRLMLGGIEYIEHDVVSKSVYDLLSYAQSGEQETIVTSYNDNEIQIETAGDTITVRDGCDDKILLTIRLEV